MATFLLQDYDRTENLYGNFNIILGLFLTFFSRFS